MNYKKHNIIYLINIMQQNKNGYTKKRVLSSKLNFNPSMLEFKNKSIMSNYEIDRNCSDLRLSYSKIKLVSSRSRLDNTTNSIEPLHSKLTNLNNNREKSKSKPKILKSSHSNLGTYLINHNYTFERQDVLKNFTIKETNNILRITNYKVKKPTIKDNRNLEYENMQNINKSKQMIDKMNQISPEEFNVYLESQDNFVDEDQETYKLKKEIRDFIKLHFQTVNYFERTESIETFFSLKENVVNFKEDIMAAPNIKNTIYMNNEYNEKNKYNVKKNFSKIDNLYNPSAVSLKLLKVLNEVKIQTKLERDETETEFHKVNNEEKAVLLEIQNKINEEKQTKEVQSTIKNPYDCMEYLTSKFEKFEKVDFERGRASHEIERISIKAEKLIKERLKEENKLLLMRETKRANKSPIRNNSMFS